MRATRARPSALLRRGALAAAALVLAACGPAPSLEARLERGLLLRERDALRRELAREPSADHDASVVVAVHTSLLERLVRLALPIEVEVEGFRVTASEADVDLRGGLALVRLAARVERVEAGDVHADLDVVGVLEVAGIDEETGSLTARVEILGFETRDVRVAGLSPPAERLLDELVSRPAEDLNRLLERIEIPVRLAHTIRLPAVAEPDLTIDAAEVGLGLRVHGVRVTDDRLWVQIDVESP